jgi:hypothetical protein
LAPFVLAIAQAPFNEFKNSEGKTKMRRILTIAVPVAFFAMLAFAESWSGTLLDATCMDTQKNVKACSATPATTAFLLQVDGKTYKLDETGNTKAAQGLKSRADRTEPNAPPTTSQISAKVSGTIEGDIIKVESIEVQ